MGKKLPPAIVSPKEFKERTALTFHSRSALTLKLDTAYQAFYQSDTEYKRKQLYGVLQEYRAAHGGHWGACERNLVSGGLLEWLHNEVAPPNLRISSVKARKLDHAAATDIRDVQIPHSRFGVLYLLGSIDISLNLINVAVEGVSVVGGAIGQGFALDTGKMNDFKNSSKAGTDVFGPQISARQLVTAGQVGVKLMPKAASGVKTIYQKGLIGAMGTDPKAVPKYHTVAPVKPPEFTPPPPAKTNFPCTVAALEAIAGAIPDNYSENRYVGAAAVAGFALVSPVTLAGDLAYNVAQGMLYVYNKIKEGLAYIRDQILAKLGMDGHGAKLAIIAKAATKYLLEELLKSAAPFIGGLMRAGGGLVKTFQAAATRLASYMDRKKIRIVPGHPEEIANSIEDCMNQGIFKGLLDVLKGAGELAVSAFLPGLGSLVAAIMTAIEWLVKFIWRVAENLRIKAFLERAWVIWENESKHCTKLTHDVMKFTKKDGTEDTMMVKKPHWIYQPNMTPGTLITDMPRFTQFFREGCAASPLIPMFVLTSGLCGSLMTLVQMFSDKGEMSLKAKADGSNVALQYDVAGRYFKRLKEFASTYLADCGFEIRPRDINNKFIEGLVQHVKLHHKGPMTFKGGVVKFLATT